MKKAITYTIISLSVLWTAWIMFYGPPNGDWRRFGVSNGYEVYCGDYWTLFTSMFVHVNWMHLLFNVYWMRILGAYTEERYGPLFYLSFIFVCGFLSATIELSVADQTGVGLSGVLYGIFGFLWGSILFQKEEHDILPKQTIQMFLGWLLLCVVLTYTKVMHIANGAHVTGLLFGLFTAYIRTGHPLVKKLAWPCSVAACAVLLFYNPWSYPWLASRAYTAQESGNFAKAEDYYSRILERKPKDPWALQNRGFVRMKLGKMEGALNDMALLKEEGSQ